MIRRRMVFTGAVQGVGFRWRARHAASLYGCTGWCRNEWDGSVTLELQGEAGRIDQVLHAIAQGSFIRIESMTDETMPLRPEERDFRTD